MRTFRTLPLLFLLIPLLSGCGDEGPIAAAAPDAFSGYLLDGRVEGGNPNFYFAPPVAPEVNSSGTFNPDLAVRVEICRPGGYTAIACGDILVQGHAQVSVADETYAFNWQTKQTGAVPGSIYRVFIFVGEWDEALGFVDLEILSDGRGKNRRSSTSGEESTFSLVNNSTVPIKTRIEQGAVIWAATGGESTCGGDCVEATVTSAEGGTVITEPLSYAAAIFPEGWIREAAGVTEVTVSISREPVPCLGTELPEAGECYRFRTFPDVGLFEELVTVNVCPNESNSVLYQRSEQGGVSPVPQPAGLQEVINCAAPLFAMNPDAHPLVQLAYGGLNAVHRFISPKPLFATDLGAGGLLGSFSWVGWAVPVELDYQNWNDPVGAAAGATLSPSVSVRTAHNHPNDGEPQRPLEGVTVTFTAQQGNAQFMSTSAVTDANGTATVNWTLPQTPGTYSVTASVADGLAGGASLTFTAQVGGLVSFYEADGNSQDAVGPNDGVLSGAVTYATGFNGLAFAFNGTAGAINAPDNGIANANRVTLAAWVNLDGQLPSSNRIARFITLGNEKAVLRLDSQLGPQTPNALHFYAFGIGGGVGVYSPAGQSLTGRGCYYHVAGTYDGVAIRLYLNGQEVASAPYTADLATGNGIMISSPAEPMHGAIDEARIYNRALSLTEIQALHAQTGSNRCPAVELF